jgi:hypothetical protein
MCIQNIYILIYYNLIDDIYIYIYVWNICIPSNKWCRWINSEVYDHLFDDIHICIIYVYIRIYIYIYIWYKYVYNINIFISHNARLIVSHSHARQSMNAAKHGHGQQPVRADAIHKLNAAKTQCQHSASVPKQHCRVLTGRHGESNTRDVNYAQYCLSNMGDVADSRGGPTHEKPSNVTVADQDMHTPSVQHQRHQMDWLRKNPHIDTTWGHPNESKKLLCDTNDKRTLATLFAPLLDVSINVEAVCDAHS